MTTTRRLAAILAADVADYSAAMERDEEGTFARVRALRREVIEPKLAEHHDIKQVGRELGVRYVLEGSVRKAGGRVRITGQLIEATTNNHLWADKYDGTGRCVRPSGQVDNQHRARGGAKIEYLGNRSFAS
jgi:class 3 adenylate cyclase